MGWNKTGEQCFSRAKNLTNGANTCRRLRSEDFLLKFFLVPNKSFFAGLSFVRMRVTA